MEAKELFQIFLSSEKDNGIEILSLKFSNFI